MTGDSDEPGELHGYGPIVASMARDVAATGTWRCAITDPVHGTLLGLGTSTYTPGYRPSAKLRRHLQTRDRTCRFPGCNAPATGCDVDHTRPYPGGATCECNGGCLCTHHHRIKHETGFRVRFSTNPDHPPGTLIWTGPAGHEYPDYPATLDPSTPENTAMSTKVGKGTAATTRPGNDNQADNQTDNQTRPSTDNQTDLGHDPDDFDDSRPTPRRSHITLPENLFDPGPPPF